MGLPVHSYCSRLCVCASSRCLARLLGAVLFLSLILVHILPILPQIPAIPACVAHVMAPIAPILPQVARVAPRVRGIAVLHVLPHVPAILSDVLGVVADVLAVAAQLAAVVADFLAVLLHIVRILGQKHRRYAHGERQHGNEGDMTSHTWSRLRFAGKTLLPGGR